LNPLRSLEKFGQAVWLDFVARGFVAGGGLKKLIDEDGLRGVTSNPAIFEKAIGQGADYDASLQQALQRGDLSVVELYERLAIEDIQAAADVLRPVYDATSKHDGYVSLEVSPYLALQTEETIEEARRLWNSVGRENLMVKVPATPAGLPAIRQLISEGINVNITLLFSQDVHEEVVEAYLSGLEQLVKRGGDPSGVASVASFFVSRIDVAVDKIIDERLRGTNDAETRSRLEQLKGKVAIANAKLAYQRYKRLFAGPRWEKLRAAGAQTQRLLWASTGTKNPAYRDVIYVEELIGPDTVNTIPPATMDAFRDHGRPRPSLEEDVPGAERTMKTIAELKIPFDDVTRKLVEEGVQLFVDAADKLLAAVAKKRAAILGSRLNGMRRKLPAELETAVAAALEDWRRGGKVRRLWAKDASLWTGGDEAKWLGWLDIVDRQLAETGRFRAFTDEVQKEGFSHGLLLGMGGSSLGPEVLAQTFGRQQGAPEFLVLDSTDPAQVRSFESRIDPARTLFTVSSKSGSTLEPNILKQYFFELAKQALDADRAGSHFIAITDPGSKMQQVAEQDRFRKVFFGDPEIGGRYSVLSDFGMVPAAAMGIDVERFLKTTATMVRSCDAGVPPDENPGVILGAIMGVAAKAGRDKLTVIASPGMADVGAWLEQLIAESTGKQGKGIIPLDGEPPLDTASYGHDRLFAYLSLAGSEDAAQQRRVAALEAAGHPVIRIAVGEPYQLGQEFFRWEIATAVAGSILAINPFDQPDVEASKIKTRGLTSEYEKTGKLPPETPIVEGGGVKLFTDRRNAAELDTSSPEACLRAHLRRIRPGDYFALLAFLEMNDRHRRILQEVRHAVLEARKVATCLGFGPRYLHSTGQAYKGGPNTGVFLLITADPAVDIPVPGQKYTFGTVIAAQARGDFDVLLDRERRALRIHLGPHVAAGLEGLRDLVRAALRG
jgi:transaldolase/glucose-6-phosphate isomerase